MANAVDRFRVDLSEKVRRISRNSAHESSIDEIVAHFEGIFTELVSTGQNENEAEREARRRIGSLHRTGLQIVNTPGRVRSGVRIQKAMLVGLTLATITCFFAMIGAFGRTLIVVPAMEFLMGCGLLMGIGCFMARRLVWKGIALSVLLSVCVGGWYHSTRLTDSLETKRQSEEIMRIMPRVQGIEATLSNLFASASEPSFGKDLATLESQVQSANVDYFNIDPMLKGQYLYPARISYPTNLVYSVEFQRTNDLSLARAFYRSDSPIRRRFAAVIADRSKSFGEWQEIYDHRYRLWLLGLKSVTRMALPTALLFLVMSGLGYMLGFVRLFGFDWMPIARKA